MQIGVENRKQVIIASVLGLLAVVQVVRMAWPDSAPAPVASSASTIAIRTSSSTSSPSSISGTKTKTNPRFVADAQSSLDPTLRLQLLHSVEGLTYSGNGRNIFTEQAEVVIPKVVTPPIATGPVVPVIPPPPQITLKFFGFTNKPGEAKKVFLSEGEDVFIASEGEIVNRRYRVVRISPNAVEIEDVLYKHSQSIPLTQS